MGADVPVQVSLPFEADVSQQKSSVAHLGYTSGNLSLFLQ